MFRSRYRILYSEQIFKEIKSRNTVIVRKNILVMFVIKVLK